MAEDLGDKTEAPTAKRRTEAREQGNIARSQELTAAALLIAFLLLIQQTGDGLVKALRFLVGQMLSGDSLGDSSTADLRKSVLDAIIPVAWAAAPLFVGSMVVAVLVNILQVGFNFNTKRLQPNIGALNPLKGVGRIFKGPNFVQMLFNVAKMTLVGFAAWSAISGRIDQIIFMQQLSFLQAFVLASQIVFSIAMRIGVVLLVIALLDYAYQKWRVERDLKMTKQQVKDEMRGMDGDPKIKARRRQIAMQLHQQRLKKEVPTADVIVTNPTHFAVALKYDAGAMHAPRVVAKGADFMALRIRELAVANGIPILERPPLARSLFNLCRVGEEIPEQFYATVAEILAYVYDLTGKAKKKAG